MIEIGSIIEGPQLEVVVVIATEKANQYCRKVVAINDSIFIIGTINDNDTNNLKWLHYQVGDIQPAHRWIAWTKAQAIAKEEGWIPEGSVCSEELMELHYYRPTEGNKIETMFLYEENGEVKRGHL